MTVDVEGIPRKRAFCLRISGRLGYDFYMDNLPDASKEGVRFIESTAGQAAAELARWGIGADRRITILIEPDDWMAEARRFSRPEVIAAGLSDADIDHLIKTAQREVEPLLPR